MVLDARQDRLHHPHHGCCQPMNTSRYCKGTTQGNARTNLPMCERGQLFAAGLKFRWLGRAARTRIGVAAGTPSLPSAMHVESLVLADAHRLATRVNLIECRLFPRALLPSSNLPTGFFPFPYPSNATFLLCEELVHFLLSSAYVHMAIDSPAQNWGHSPHRKGTPGALYHRRHLQVALRPSPPL